MNKRKLFTLLLSAALTFTFTACTNTKEVKNSAQNETITQTSNDVQKNNEPTITNAEASPKKISKDKNSLFNLGKTQTQEIKKVLEAYGATVGSMLEPGAEKNFYISKDENNVTFDNIKGYQGTTMGFFNTFDSLNHEYKISYDSIMENGKTEGKYKYFITIKYPSTQPFEIENAQMLIKLVKVIDQNYDMFDFNKWVNDSLKKNKEQDPFTTERDHGAYHENLKCTKYNNGATQQIIYTVTLN